MTPFLKKISAFLIALLLGFSVLNAQVVSSTPEFPLPSEQITIFFDASAGNAALNNFSGDIYAHTGVILESSSSNSDWKYVIADWSANTDKAKLTKISDNYYKLIISPDVFNFYGVPSSEKITHLAFVFRSSDGSKVGRNADGSDILVELSDGSLKVKINNPTASPLFVDYGSTIAISATADGASSMQLFIDQTAVSSANATTISYTHTVANYNSHKIKVIASDGTNTAADSIYYFTRIATTEADVPEGYHDGINILSETSAALVLTAPGKKNVFVYGDFSAWQPNENYMMKRSKDGEKFWLEMNNLDPNKTYVYQYLIDEQLFIADPYTSQTVDPNDQYIASETYPNLLPYPAQARGVAGILQTNPATFSWEVPNFEKPDQTNLVIYELHLRDFTEKGDIKTVTDTLPYLKRLGINAIELMPINEFEGNDSWGYNPSFYFATDKAYGTINDYKNFIDECHKNGIAVIIDMVLNHSYSQSPFVQMYFDASAGDYGQPTANNPWYNQTSPNTSYSWGYDFNHESSYTKTLVDSVNRFWIDEFKVDGFRFDFTKGFTNTGGDGWAYDAARIEILTRMADKIWSYSPDAYVILEHLADNSEEKTLANHGILMWGNLNHAYAQCMMGYADDSNISWANYKNRGWNNPHLVSYAESHDEQRTMFKVFSWGNASDFYDTKEKYVATQRAELAALFHIPIPGPKMIWQFQELGYDVDIDENGRVGRKPIHWEYKQDPDRNRIYNMFRILNKMKQDYPTFKTNDFELIDNGLIKKLYLRHNDMDVVIIGNFNVENKDVTVDFPTTGTWYNFFEKTEIEISETGQTFSMYAGQYLFFSTKKIDIPNYVTSISFPEKMESFRIFPNPIESNLNFNTSEFTERVLQVKIYDFNGRTLYAEELLNDEHQNSINISGLNLQKGLYIMEIRSKNSVAVANFLKN